MTDSDDSKEGFIPKGSIAFFAVMICFYIALWLVFYFLMVGRH